MESDRDERDENINQKDAQNVTESSNTCASLSNQTFQTRSQHKGSFVALPLLSPKITTQRKRKFCDVDDTYDLGSSTKVNDFDVPQKRNWQKIREKPFSTLLEVGSSYQSPLMIGQLKVVTNNIEQDDNHDDDFFRTTTSPTIIHDSTVGDPPPTWEVFDLCHTLIHQSTQSCAYEKLLSLAQERLSVSKADIVRALEQLELMNKLMILDSEIILM